MQAGMTVGDVGIGVGTILSICITQGQVGAVGIPTVGIPTVGIILAHPWLLQLGMIGPAAMRMHRHIVIIIRIFPFEVKPNE